MGARARVVLLAVTGVLVLAVGGGLLWWHWPTFAVRAALRDVELPESVRLTDRRMDHNRICFDSCQTNGSRFYVTDLPPEEAADVVAGALRQAGWTVRVEPCTRGCSFAPQPFDYMIQKWTWEVRGEKGGLEGTALVGTRGDGRPGVQLGVSPE